MNHVMFHISLSPDWTCNLKCTSAVVMGNALVKEETKEEKIVTAMKKGSAVLDKCMPDHIKAQYHVLQEVCHLMCS